MPEHMIHIICIILMDELFAFIVFLLGLYDKFRAPYLDFYLNYCYLSSS